MDELTQKELATLLAVYREQTLHLLDEMTADLLALEAGTADADALARLRRAAHTIKGDSVCVMLEGVAESAHRIEAEKIDALLNLASEMVIARSVLNQVGAQFEEQMAQSELVRRARESHLQISKLVSELQKNVLRMRMVTIDTIFKRFARPMRQLALESSKRVELEMLGGETELDRALTDALYEPLLHLLRNAI